MYPMLASKAFSDCLVDNKEWSGSTIWIVAVILAGDGMKFRVLLGLPNLSMAWR